MGVLRGAPAEGVAENRRFEARGRLSPPYFLKTTKLDNIKIKSKYRDKIIKCSDKPLKEILEIHEDIPYFGIDLPIR